MSETRVLYNASCPVCRREIEHYQGYCERRGVPVSYDDLQDADLLKPWGVTPDEAAKRLHVRKGDQIYVGVPAFIALWQSLPRYRWLGRVLRIPGIFHLTQALYERGVAPMLYRRHLIRSAKQARTGGK